MTTDTDTDTDTDAADPKETKEQPQVEAEAEVEPAESEPEQPPPKDIEAAASGGEAERGEDTTPGASSNSKTSTSLVGSLKQSILNPYGNEQVVAEAIIAEGEAGGATIAEDEDDGMAQALSEDIYSLMSTVPACSLSFLFAILVFLMQFLIIILVLLDLIDTTSNPRKTNGVVNRMGIPVDTPIPVRAAQFIGVILIVNFGAGEGDLLEGFSHLLNGYDARIIEASPYATRLKWYIAGICQLLVGMGLTVNLFVLMMRSTSNIELCLNFAALHFVQDIDDVAFTMGSMGLISRRVQKDCNHTGDIMIAANKQYRRNDWIKRGFLLALTIVLYTLFFVIASWQWNGRFMCHTLYVQFGDVHGPEWPYYSGLFDTVGHNLADRMEDRPVYLDATTHTIRLAYCSGEEAWTFSNISETNDHCNYFIKSSTTTTYDIMDVAHQIWYAFDNDLGDVPMDHLLMDCNDCDTTICAPNVGTCNPEANRCICNEDRMGINCEFRYEDACDFMALDRRSKASLSALPFAALFTRKEYTKYFTGNINQIYDRPFYVSFTPDGLYVDVFIIFSGYRWIIYGVPQEETTNTTIAQFDSYLLANNPNVNPLQTLSTISSDALPYFEPLFFSSPVKFETDSHEVDPIDVQWVLATIDETLPQVGAKADVNHQVSASFLCSKCNTLNNTCFNGGYCNETTTKCQCVDVDTGIQSYGGNMCEYAFSCIEFRERENRTLNGCKCDPVFEICTECNEGYYGNLCQFKRKTTTTTTTSSVQTAEISTSGNLDEVTTTSEIVGGHYQCDNSTCLNGGYCINIASACECPQQYDGIYCENFVFLCTNTTCKNGGYCPNTTTTTTSAAPAAADSCICPQQFGGQYCDIPLVSSNTTLLIIPINNTDN